MRACRPGCEEKEEKGSREKEKRIKQAKECVRKRRNRSREKTEREREKALRGKNQPGRHSSRVCTTSLCDFYTRSDFLAAPLALVRQIYIPWLYKSRAYKDIEAKPTRISHPIPFAFLFSPCHPPSRFSLPHPVCHHTWYTLLFYQPLPFTSSFFTSFYFGPKMGYKKTKNRRASPITGSVFLSSSCFLTLSRLTTVLTTC